MCGIACRAGAASVDVGLLARMVEEQAHRGPDAEGLWVSADGTVGLGHRRLSILDVARRGDQPMTDPTGRFTIVFNGEVYNYVELREQLRSHHEFRTTTDTEVVLAAVARWGLDCLDRFIGMFAFVVWDERDRVLFGARDRFGVKPMFLSLLADGGVAIASEVKALHAGGVRAAMREDTWSRYLGDGIYDDGSATFWDHVERVPPGHALMWSGEDGLRVWPWYRPDLTPDERPEHEVVDEAIELLTDAVRLRFRADVPVGFCLSGGLDSSLVAALAARGGVDVEGLHAFTFHTADPEYDERAWADGVAAAHGITRHHCELRAADVPVLAARMQRSQDEPFGGLPTLGMGLVHERAAQLGVTVLLDGNGLDEGWGGYDYYRSLADHDLRRAPVQASAPTDAPGQRLLPEFASIAPPPPMPTWSGDPLRNAQLHDAFTAKLPRALRFADRASMAAGRELREPFIDHRLLELGVRQPVERKIRDGEGKWLIRSIATRILDPSVALAPKRPVQTPQREWFRRDLADWVGDCIETVLARVGGTWLDAAAVRAEWQHYRVHGGSSSNHLWQLVSLALALDVLDERARG